MQAMEMAVIWGFGVGEGSGAQCLVTTENQDLETEEVGLAALILQASARPGRWGLKNGSA